MGAKHVLARGVELTIARGNLRHASVLTTSVYLHSDEVRKAQQIGKLLPPEGSRKFVAIEVHLKAYFWRFCRNILGNTDRNILLTFFSFMCYYRPIA